MFHTSYYSRSLKLYGGIQVMCEKHSALGITTCFHITYFTNRIIQHIPILNSNQYMNSLTTNPTNNEKKTENPPCYATKSYAEN